MWLVSRTNINSVYNFNVLPWADMKQSSQLTKYKYDNNNKNMEPKTDKVAAPVH